MRRLLLLVVLAAMVIASLLAPRWFAGAPMSAPVPTPAVPAAAATASPPSETTDEPAASAERTAVPVSATPNAASLVGRLVNSDGAPLAAELLVRSPDAALPRVPPVVTGADGRFSVSLPAGLFTLHARGGSVPCGTSFGRVRLVARQQYDLGDLVVPAGATLRGRVVDMDERPIAGVRVMAGGGIRFDDAAGDFVASDGLPPHEVATDRDGAFALIGVASELESVVVVHPDFATSTATRPDSDSELWIVLEPRASLHGVVVDESGAPIAGARVVPGDGEDALWSGTPTTTAADGTFTMRGFGGTLSVLAAGYQRQVQKDCEAGAAPLRIVLSAVSRLAGRVLGATGHTGEVFVECNVGLGRELPPKWSYAISMAKHEVAADGSFAIEGLPANAWRIRAVVPGVGCTKPLDVDGPPVAPLELQVEPYRHVALRVVDDLGAAVPGAEVALVELDEDKADTAQQAAAAARWFGYAVRTTRWTDDQGSLVIDIAEHQRLGVAARSPDHLAAGTVLAGDAPDTITIALPRAARVHGRVRDAAVLAQVAAYVQLTPAEGASRRSRLGFDVDPSGAFVSGALQPGRWRIAAYVGDVTGRSRDLHRRAAVPLLGDFVPWTPMQEIDLAAGADVEVEFVLPRFGEMQGRVLCAGVPVSGAIVRARAENGQPHIHEFDPGDIDPIESEPQLRTDRDGRFRFLVAARGPWTVRARHPRSPAWVSRPITIEDASSMTTVELQLPGAAVRGVVATASVTPRDRRFLGAQLLRSEEALQIAMEGSGFSQFTDWELPLHTRRLRQELGASSSFAFEMVPAGTWILRIGSGFGLGAQPIVRAVNVRDGEVLDLGTITPAAPVTPQLRCAMPARAPDADVWTATASACIGATDDAGVGWMSEVRAQDGVCALPQLPPGRYRLQLVETEKLVGAPVDFTLRADGSCEPATAALRR